MDVLYIPQLDDGDGSGESPTSGRYRILKRIPEDGTVLLSDRAVTRVEVSASDPLKLVLPPEAKGAARDFFVRLVVTAEEPPEVTFAPPEGEAVSFEGANDDVFKCRVGVNVYAFTETDAGIFLVNGRRADISMEVAFDTCGGTLPQAKRTYQLGAQYGELPFPTRAGYSFVGWFTAAEGGVGVGPGDRCKGGVTRLYAHWEVYVDPFVDAICPAKNITFFSETSVPWTVDTAIRASAPGSARSGAIPDNGLTTLKAVVQGKGTLSFKWKVSSEQNYDKLRFSADGREVAAVSGETGWTSHSQRFDTDAAHTVEWAYTKDGSSAHGSDCGWVDDVVWTPEG